MQTQPTISRKLAVTSIFVASYLPPLVGLAFGVTHCDVCRSAWLTLVWIVQGTLLSELFQRVLSLPRVDIDTAGGYTIAVVLQLVWLAGWSWLTSKGKVWLAISIVVCLSLTIWFTFVIDALIRM